MQQQDPKDGKAGLARLKAAVEAPQIERTWKNSQRPSTVAKTAEFCLLWTPTDTYQSFLAKHPAPGMDAEKVHARMLRIRGKVPGIPKRVFLSGYQIAQAYLASLPSAYHKATEP